MVDPLFCLPCLYSFGWLANHDEIGIGKLSQKNPVGAFRALDKVSLPLPSSVYWVLIAFLILSYYSVVAGWSIEYSLASVEKNSSCFEAVLGDYLKEPKKVQKLQEEAFKESMANPLPDNTKKS